MESSMENSPDAYGAGLLDHKNSSERHRLRALESFADPATFSMLKSIGIQSGWRCLEIGAGAGSVARRIAELCAPGETVATDIDISLLPTDIPNMTVMSHDVTSDTFPSGSFDVVHTRAVLEHLRDRDAVLERIVDWIAPGGWLCIDAVWLTPPVVPPPLNRCITGLADMAANAMGADVAWAPQVPGIMAANGLRDITISCTPGVVGAGQSLTDFMLRLIRQVEPVLLTQPGLDASDLKEASRLMESDRCITLVMMLLSIRGRKPDLTSADSPGLPDHR